jgi:hypothetical protein
MMEHAEAAQRERGGFSIDYWTKMIGVGVDE